jgi:hypothetical protein
MINVREHHGMQVTTLDVCATMGAPVPPEDKPGRVSAHSSNVRTGFCHLSRVPTRVVKRPRWPRVCWERRRRSAVAALMESSCLRDSSYLSKDRRSRATDPFALPHASRPFVRSRALACWFGQRSSTCLYSRGKGNKIQEEKDDSDMIEEDFGEAMQHFWALLAKDVTRKLGAFGKKCRLKMKAGFPELRAL